MDIIAGFLPHSYVTEKLKLATKNLEDVWSILEDLYNVKITSSTLLDFAQI